MFLLAVAGRSWRREKCSCSHLCLEKRARAWRGLRKWQKKLPGVVWKLKKVLQGLEGSSQTWSNHATQTLLEKHRLRQSKTDECSYLGRDLLTMRHMGDFITVGPTVRV